MKKSGSLFSGFPGIFQTGGGELLCRFLCPPYGLSEVSEASSAWALATSSSTNFLVSSLISSCISFEFAVSSVMASTS